MAPEALPRYKRFMASHPAPEKGNSFGCIGCLGTLFFLILLTLFGIYWLIFQTPLPLQLAAGQIDKANANLTITGTTGNLGRGFAIASLSKNGEKGTRTEIEGFTFRSSGLLDLFLRKRLVIEELSVKRAHFVIAPDSLQSDDEEEDKSDIDHDSGDSEQLNLFEIQRIDLRNVRIETTDGSFVLDLPRFTLEGFRVAGNDFDLESLIVESNYVEAKLRDAEPREIDGTTVPFTRRLEGSIKDSAHAALVQDIDFAIDLGAMDGDVVSRLTAFGDRWETLSLPGEESRTTLRNWTPGDYFTQDLLRLPDSIHLQGSSGSGSSDDFHLESGSLRIGKVSFQLPPGTMKDSDPLVGKARWNDLDLTVEMRQRDSAPYVVTLLSSLPERPLPELLSGMHFDRMPEELSEEQKELLRALIQTYGEVP